MDAAAQTSGLPNLSTAAERLLAVLRWLAALLIIHWLTTWGRKLAAALDGPSGPDDAFLATSFGTTDRTEILARITRALRRAADLETELLSRRPTEQGYPIEFRRAVGAQIIDICGDLGIFRPARSSLVASNTAPRARGWIRSPRAPRLRGECPIPPIAACHFRSAASPCESTGPPLTGRLFAVTLPANNTDRRKQRKGAYASSRPYALAA